MARYAVIGAGAAGVSAMAVLRAAGYDAECFERTDRVGGHWHTDYDALHLITSRDTTGFAGFPMPASYPHFPRRDEVRDYIESYAREHGLDEQITFGTEVVSVDPVPGEGAPGSAGWRVLTSPGDDGVFDGVLVANGHLWSPHLPSVPGEFTGLQVHSSGYTNPSQIPGERVLVVGAGNSGADIAGDLAQHRLEVDIVVRKGIHFQAKSYYGVPRAELAELTALGPDEQDRRSRELAEVKLGPASCYPGLPAPDTETLAEGAVTVNDLLLYWVQHGRITIRPGIDRLGGRSVHFADGTSGDYDAIVWATGFDVALPFLDPGLIDWVDGIPVRYSGGILPSGVEKLYFIGLIGPRGPQLPVYGTQAELVVRMLALHEQAGPGGAGLAAYFAQVQEPEHRIDVVRARWNEQLADTAARLSELGSLTEAAR